MQEFPPKSTLDPSKYGDHTSTITAAHIEKNLEGLTVQQVVFLSANKSSSVCVIWYLTRNQFVKY
jgi:hypothetical protein